jgi:hypothetical protein
MHPGSAAGDSPRVRPHGRPWLPAPGTPPVTRTTEIDARRCHLLPARSAGARTASRVGRSLRTPCNLSCINHPSPVSSASAHRRSFDPDRSAVRWTLLSALAVGLIFLAGRHATDVHTGQQLDYLHWTLAYAVATALAWSGVRRAEPADRAPRRWLALGLTFTLLAQGVFDVRELTQWTPCSCASAPASRSACWRRCAPPRRHSAVRSTWT